MLLRSTATTIASHIAALGLPIPKQVHADLPPDRTLGDVATNYPLTVSKELGRSPKEIAEELAVSLRGDTHFSEVTVAAPGFVNLRLSPKTATELLETIALKPLEEPVRDVLAGHTYLYEFGSENIAKPMSVGHLRSNIIGMACTRLARMLGARVIAVDYNGDWGTQFGMVISAYKKWGDRATVEASPITELVSLYQRYNAEIPVHPELQEEARETFRRLEHGESPEDEKLWKWFAELSRAEFDRVKARLNVQHDIRMCESDHREELPGVIQLLLSSKVGTLNADGSVAVEFRKDDKLPSCLARKSDGSSLYLTRDLAALRYRLDTWHPDRLVYFISDQQALYLRQLERTAQRLGWEFHFEHAAYGLILGASGRKMATREGTAVLAQELFGRAEQEAMKVLTERGSDVPEADWPRVARDLATASVMYNDLSQNRTTTIVFDWEQMLSFDGDTAPYLLYTVARINALEKKAADGSITSGVIRIGSPLEHQLAVALLAFHDRVAQAAETLKPNLLANQLYRIAQAFNSFYAELPILGDDRAVSSSRLALALVARKVLRGGLDLLGIPHVYQM